MELSYDDVLEIIEIIERSNVGYLEVEAGETKIILDKSGMTARSGSEEQQITSRQEPQDTVTVQPRAANGNLTNSAEIDSDSSSNIGQQSTLGDLIEIKAPVVGVFYRQSEPGAPPYVEIGSKVSCGETVGLLEVMKMFTGVTAPADGIIEKILVDNNDFVEFDQPLMLIRPGI